MAAGLPDYVKSAQPVPQDQRVSWFNNIAPTYAGIMLWFVFWHDVPVGSNYGSGAVGKFSEFAGGTLTGGLAVAIVGLIIAALICHFLFYLVPGLLGMRTGLPLYIVGTSTYGVRGGFIMPGFIMGVLQFGWLAVNAYFAGILLLAPWKESAPPMAHGIVAAVWAIAAAFMGLKGIQYVAKVATFLPLIPFVILIILFVKTIGGVGEFNANPEMAVVETITTETPDGEVGEVLKPAAPLAPWQIIALMSTYVVGFFATAGAAGSDIAMNGRSSKDVHIGGFVGIFLCTVFTGVLALLIVAGVYGMGGATEGNTGVLRATELMGAAVGGKTADVFMYLLAIAAFPAACFSSFIAANSFKTTLPKVNPFVSVGIGTVVAIILAATGLAGKSIDVFKIIGASFGPVCGAMMADYLLAGRKWAGPRAGFNAAGWISWIVGFAVGAVDFIARIPGLEMLKGTVPAAPVAAFVVGFVLYVILAKLGLEGKTLEMPGGKDAGEAPAEN